MTENEAMDLDRLIEDAKVLAKEKDTLARTFRGFKDYGNPKSTITSGAEKAQKESEQYEHISKLFEELKQYRAIGTVERFEQLSKQFAPHNVDETSCHLRQCNKCDMYRKENEKYHAIGTVDEFKALKNKHIGKDNMVISSSDLMTILNSDSEELKKYKEVGTVEECRNVMELMKKLINRKMTVEVLENYMQFEDECVKEGYTFKSILEARKKIKPKKPIFKFEYEDGRQFYDCPVCGAYVMHAGVQSKERYCSNCGIKLDWSE